MLYGNLSSQNSVEGPGLAGGYRVSPLSFISPSFHSALGIVIQVLTPSPPFHTQLSRDRAISCQAASLIELPRKGGLGGRCSFSTAGELSSGHRVTYPGSISQKAGELLLEAEAVDSKSSAH